MERKLMFFSAGGSDYVVTGGTLSVSSNSPATALIFVTDDDEDEGTENFFVNLTMSDNTPCATATATIVILDNDGDTEPPTTEPPSMRT